MSDMKTLLENFNRFTEGRFTGGSIDIDPLSDEGEDYAATLNNNGVNVEHIHYPNMFHGFVTMTKLKAAEYAANNFLEDYKEML